MKISKSYLNVNEEFPSSVMEINDQVLIKKPCKNSLNRDNCRSFLPLESQSHRYYGKINQSSFAAPKRCNINGGQYSEQVFSILQYQLNDEKAKATHFNNLKRNLERRIQSAKAKGNTELVALLTQEFRQIGS